MIRDMTLLYRVGVPLSVALGRCPVAVAGTRDPTPWGRRLARELGRRLAEEGYAVVTGLAHGIDEETTVGALDVGGLAVGVLPYLLERGGRLNPRATWLLYNATKYGTSASAVAENLVEDDSQVRKWFAMRNRIIVRISAALVVPEARFKPAHWGTRYAVEHALSAGRPVVVLKPRVADGGLVKAFEYFRRHSALVANDVNEAVGIVERQCRYSLPSVNAP
jgi:DNA processing protein